MSDYILSYQLKASCPNHSDDYQNMWMLFDPNDIHLKGPAFLICFICTRVAEISGKGGEVQAGKTVPNFHRNIKDWKPNDGL